MDKIEQFLYERAIDVADEIFFGIKHCCGNNNVGDHVCSSVSLEHKLSGLCHMARAKLCNGKLPTETDNHATGISFMTFRTGNTGERVGFQYRPIMSKICIKPITDDKFRNIALQCLIFKLYNILVMGGIQGKHYFQVRKDPTFGKYVFTDCRSLRQSIYLLEEYISYAKCGFTYEWVITMSQKLFDELATIRKVCEASEIDARQDIKILYDEKSAELIDDDIFTDKCEEETEALLSQEQHEWDQIELMFWRKFKTLYAKSKNTEKDNSTSKA